MTYSFNITPVMVECRAYVDAIEDFRIETPGQTDYTQHAVIQHESDERIKILLSEFLLECEQAFATSQLNLIQLLRRNKNHYQATQATTIRKLNELIESTTQGERAQYEDKKERFFKFFHHNYTLIELISVRSTNSPLSELLQFELKRVGLDWIVNGSQHPAPQPQQPGGINEQSTTRPRLDMGNNLNSYVSTFTDINMRIGLLLSFSDLNTQRLDSVITGQLKDFIDADELQPAIADYFVSRNETALQLTYAKTLVENLLTNWLPVIKSIERAIIELQSIKYIDIQTSETGELISMAERDLLKPEFCAVDENLKELWQLSGSLERYNRMIIHQIKQFAPTIYTQYRDRFSEYFDLREREIKTIDPAPQSTQSGVKGQWKNLPPKILLLDKLGFFKLPEVERLSFESKGKLISMLCGGSSDNAVDYIRHCDPKRTALENNPYRNPKNVKAVEDLLNQLNTEL